MYEITMSDTLCHYNTKGSHWYQQGPGKRYQAHAKYAMGKPNPETSSRAEAKVLSAFSGKRMGTIKDAFSRSIEDVKEQRRKEYEKHLAKEALIRERAAEKTRLDEAKKEGKKALKTYIKTGVMPKSLTDKTHSGNTLGMTTDELKSATARLKAENEYLREFENRAKLEATYKELTAPASKKRIKSLLKTAGNIGKSDVGKIAQNIAMTSLYNEVKKRYDKDTAERIFAGTRITGGNKGGGNNDQQGGGNNKRNKKGQKKG